MYLSVIRCVAVILAAVVAAPARAQPGDSGGGLRWQIDSFDVSIIVRPDGVLDITERVAADFSREAHHGIIRDIPYAYRRAGTDYKLRIDVKDITDDAGHPHRYKTSRSGGSLSIRIGDPGSYAS